MGEGKGTKSTQLTPRFRKAPGSILNGPEIDQGAGTEPRDRGEVGRAGLKVDFVL